MLDKHDLLSIALLVYRAGEFDTPTVTVLPSFSPPNSTDYTGANVNFDKIINAADGTRAKGEIERQRDREREKEREKKRLLTRLSTFAAKGKPENSLVECALVGLEISSL